MRHEEDLTGQSFGALTVVREGERPSSRHGRQWVCRCSCGKEITLPPSKLLGRDARKSCGCRECVTGPLLRGVQPTHHINAAERKRLAAERKARADNMEAIRAMVRNNPCYGKIVNQHR